MQNTKTHASAERILTVLDLLMRHFVHGLSASDIVKSENLTAPSVSRYLSTLEATGWAERIPETNRWRASHRVAQRAMTVLSEIDKAEQRLREMRVRLTN